MIGRIEAVPIQIDVGVSGPTAEQTGLAIGFLVLIAALLVAARWRMQFVGLSDEQTRNKKALIGQRESQNARTLRIPKDADLAEYRDRVAALFEGEPPEVDDEITVRQALGSIRRELDDAIHARVEHVPRLALWFGEVAIGLAITGGLATIGVETFRRAFAKGGGLSLGYVVDVAISTLNEGVRIGLDVLGSFPYAGTLWSLAFAYSVLVAEWVWNNPFVPAGLLAAAAIAVIYLGRKAPDASDVELYQSRGTVARSIVVSAVVIWIAGVVPAALGGVIGSVTGIDLFEAIGAGAGLLAALATTGWLALQAGRSARVRLRYAVTELASESTPIIASILVRRIGVLVAGLVAPLVPIYLGYILVTGKLTAVVSAFLAGSAEMQLAVGLVVAMAIAMLVYQTRAAWPELKAAVREVTSRRAVRLALMTRGLPTVVVVIAYFIAVGFGAGAALAIVLALVAGVVSRAVYALVRRARYRASLIEFEEPTASRVVIQAYLLETADGETLFYARANTTAVAHTDRDAVVDAVMNATRDLFDDGEVRPMIARAFARDAIEFGIVDVDETETRIRQDVRTEVVGQLRRRGRIERETLEDDLEKFPEHIWSEWIRERRIRGDLRLRSGYYLLR